jgi:hypothetical protein
VTKNASEGVAVVLRATSSVVTFFAVAAIAVLFTGDAALRGRWDVALRAAGVFLLVLWAAWVVLVRMSIVAGRKTVTARNLLRYTAVPWGRVVAVERRAQLRLILDDDSWVECWGSPFPPRTARARSSQPTGDAGLETLRTAWQAGDGGTGAVRRGWDVPALLIGAVCAVCALIAVLV